MNGHLLGMPAMTTWVLADFWTSQALALVLLLARAAQGRRVAAGEGLLVTERQRLAIAWSASASSIPVLVWAVEANGLARVVEATDASVNPGLLLASMQVFLGALCSLALILGFDLLGRYLVARRTSLPLVSLPPVVILIVVTVLADWLLSQVGWWSLINHHLGTQVVSATGF
jgi:hypothetical protein